MSKVRACIYGRVSVSSEESVSIPRQVQAAEQYAAARGWEVVGTFTDDGVSATHVRPEDRAGWKAMLAKAEPYERVICWKVDRVARRTRDFLNSHAALEERGASLVAVEQSFDMGTAEGRAFASMGSVFAELEAGQISARVASARRHLIRNGRVVGGKVPFGWKSVDNPDGAGLVLARDPDCIDTVRLIVDRTLAGLSVYSTVQHLNETGVPSPTVWARKTNPPKVNARPVSGEWVYSTVERLLRHPILAGMTPFNPGNSGKTRGDDVLRDADGLPVVDERLALMSVADWRRMLAMLDEENRPQRRPRALKSSTSALLSGLVVCAEHDEPVRMWRGTTQGRPSYRCPDCAQTISGLDDLVIEEFLAAKGDRLRWRRVEVITEGGAAALPEIDRRLDELAGLIRVSKGAERTALLGQQAALLDRRDEAEGEPATVEYVYDGGDQSFGQDWAEAADVVAQRAILDDGLSAVLVRRGGTGRRTREQMLDRLTFQWIGQTGPEPVPDETWLADGVA